MSEPAKLGLKLLLIASIAGLALGFTNEMTKGPIEESTIQAAESARQAVLPDATKFEAVFNPETDELPKVDVSGTEYVIDNAYIGTDSAGNFAGYTAQTTVKGYGGKIEVIVGVDADGGISGIHVGGSSFSETVGLGAKTKDKAFTDQFIGLEAPVELNKDVDAVTSATISSRAVTNGVNAVCEYVSSLKD